MVVSAKMLGTNVFDIFKEGKVIKHGVKKRKGENDRG